MRPVRAGGPLALLVCATVLAPIGGTGASASGSATAIISVASAQRHVAGETVAIEIGSDVSDDGRLVVFSTSAALVSGDANGDSDVYVRDRRTGRTLRVSTPPPGRATFGSWDATISGNGRYVLFTSQNAYVPDPPRIGRLYVRDLEDGSIEVVDVLPDGSPGILSVENVRAISRDGSTVAFTSGYQPFVRDLATSRTRQIPAVDAYVEDLSADGSTVVFSACGPQVAVPADTNGSCDVFAHDLLTGTTTRVNVSSSGRQTETGSSSEHPRVSGDGTRIVFTSDSRVLAGALPGVRQRVYVHDRALGTTSALSTGTSTWADISADGDVVAYDRQVDRTGHTQVFVRDLPAGAEEVVNRTSANRPVDGHNSWPRLSADGRFVTFTSDVALVAQDTDRHEDVYLRDRGAP